MEMASEMMDDAIEGALDDEGVEEDTNELIDEVLRQKFTVYSVYRENIDSE